MRVVVVTTFDQDDRIPSPNGNSTSYACSRSGPNQEICNELYLDFVQLEG